MDILSRVALPAHSMLKDLLVRGDHGWVSGKATTTSTIKNAPPQGTWFASLLEDSATPDNIQIAQIIGTKLAPSSYTSIELALSVPVQQRMQTQRLCLPPRMISSPGLLQERRVSIRDHQGKAKTFWIDQEKQKSTNQILRSNDRDCLVWSSKKQEPAALHANFSAYSLGKRNNPFSLTIELGPDKSDLPKNVSVMLDSSSSVQPSTFHRGVKLFSAINKKNEGNTSLWKFSRRAEVMNPKTWPPTHNTQPGSDLIQSIQDWIAGSNSKVSTLIIVTDGLLPLPNDEGSLKALQRTLRRHPQRSIILLVDDPVLALRGVANDHPLLALASQIGARLSLQSLRAFDAKDPVAEHELLSTLFKSPQVGRDLEIKLPPGCKLETPIPSYIVSGQVHRLFGHCKKRVKLWARLSVKQGKRRSRRRIKGPRASQQPTHFASAVSTELRDQASEHGANAPAWFRRAMAKESELSFEAAAKVQERHGHLDAALIQARLREHLWPRAHACYNHALARNRAQAGVAQLSIALGKGEVSLVEASSQSLAVKDPKFLACLESAAWKLRVPAALADPVVYRIYYPLNFQRPKNADVGKISEQDKLRYEWLIGREKE